MGEDCKCNDCCKNCGCNNECDECSDEIKENCEKFNEEKE